MAHAADLMFELEQGLAAVKVDNVDEAVFVLIGFPGNQTALKQSVVRPGEISEVDCNVVAVEFGLRLVGLAEDQVLAIARRYTCVFLALASEA